MAIAYVVHYDLLGLFPVHLYGRRFMYADNEQHRHQPTFESDHLWIPRQGTDPTTFNTLPRPVTVNDDYDDGGTRNNRGKRFDDDEVRGRWPAPDTVVDRVPVTTSTEVQDDSDEDNDDYYFEQELDDNVF